MIDRVKNEIGISIRNIGEFTEQIHKLQIGDKLGLRGPYGRGFHISWFKSSCSRWRNWYGSYSSIFRRSIKKGVEVHVVSAASTMNELLFNDRIKRSGAKLLTCTDDGTHGFCGYGTDLAEKALSEENYDMVVSCGPEIMMKKLFEMVEKYKISSQFSLERYMKCGMGLCGQCCVDDEGWRVCVEGPVFWQDELRMITEFGKYKRDSSGVKHKI